MADHHRKRHRAAASAVLQIRGLHIYYGQSHALQGVDLTLEHGVHAVVGRNGMGKTTLCNGIMGLLPVRRGSIRFQGEEITGLPPYKIASCGIGYTPQGRRLWPSLSVSEHLQLTERTGGAWTTDRIYETFPRLSDRRRNNANQLSGGEQQMLAISRALLQDPLLLVLDEPTEGLAPIIVDQVEQLLATLASESDVAILLIEQNISVATSIAENVSIMINGRISRVMPARQLAADRMLQKQLLGVGRHPPEEIDLPTAVQSTPDDTPGDDLQISPSSIEVPEKEGAKLSSQNNLVYVPPTRWSNASWEGTRKGTIAPPQAPAGTKPIWPFDNKPQPLYREPKTPLAFLLEDIVLVAGTFDTKAVELNYIRENLMAHGLKVKTVDLSTSGKPSSADVPPHIIAAHYRGSSGAVFSGDRGTSVRAMSEAFVHWIQQQRSISGIISAAGSSGTALVAPAMRELPVGVPKIIISTVASGEVGQYIGAVDLMMMYSVTDVQGLNRISKRIFSNGANALAGMVKEARKNLKNGRKEPDNPALGLTMFGVTTPAIQQIMAQLRNRYECMVFHATGTGGQSMEKLVDSGVLTAAIDLTTTEVCDLLMGGVFAAAENRFAAFVRTQIPYVGSVGALDMVNFGSRDSVPNRYRGRTFVEHNPQVTLMRTTPEENVRVGEWIVTRLNEMTGPVRFLIPEGGVSSLDQPDQPFFDPEANRALFDTIGKRFKETTSRRLIRTPDHINDPAFCRTVIDALDEINPAQNFPQHATS